MKYYQLCPHCGKYAWQWKKKPKAGQTIKADQVIHNKNPKPLDEITCQNCGASLKNWHLKTLYLIGVRETKK